MSTGNHKTLDPDKQEPENLSGFSTVTDVTPGPDAQETPAERHTVPPVDTAPGYTGEYPHPNASERVDYSAFPSQEGTEPNIGNLPSKPKTAKDRNPSPLVVAIASVATTVVAIMLFYGSLTLADPISSGLALLLSSILLLISVVLLLWGGILGGKAIFFGDGDKTTPAIAIAAAVIFAPIAAFFGAIGMIAAIASWFTGFF